MNVKFSPGSVKSAVLVIVQFLCLFILGYTGELLPQNYFLRLIMLLSLVLVLWAMIIMKFNFNAAPEILPNVTLTTKGPYNLIRHPMYTSIFGLTIPWLVNDFSYFRLSVFLILLVNQLVKINSEEKILSEKFPDYPEYKKRTKKIIPFIY
jgi:protein-S-isoprenylcysteine O-methyltransferase Ste14